MIATAAPNRARYGAAVLCSTPDGIDDRDGPVMKPDAPAATSAQRLTASMIATGANTVCFEPDQWVVLNA